MSPAEGAAAEVINAAGRAPIVLVCEHASSFIPARLHGLELREEDRLSHAAWDIGALDVAKRLSAALDAPLVASRVSRLVYDCNRPPHAPDAIPAKSELILAPGNADISPRARDQRVNEIYRPFRDLLAETIAAHGATPPALITIHSFTPIYYGVKRHVELGLLHDTDDRLARAMLAHAPRFTTLRTELNEPYGPKDGVTYTLREHALSNSLINVMIEVRNDLLRDEAGIARISGELGKLIESGLDACDHPAIKSNSERRQG
ncbi:MAG: N-formylglutamate amidohydrolase [Oricola sp.]